MRNAYVAGATGTVGEAIVRALSGEPGLRIVAGSRSDERLALLTRALGDVADSVVPFVHDLRDVPSAVASARRAVERFGRFDVLIASLGGWWHGGSLIETDDATWRTVMDEMLTSHFTFARAFLPELRRTPGSRYIGIGGGAARTPVRNSSLVSIAGAAQMMMTRALASELGAAVEIMELVVDGPIPLPSADAARAKGSIAAADVGAVVAELVSGGTTTWPRTKREGPIVLMEP